MAAATKSGVPVFAGTTTLLLLTMVVVLVVTQSKVVQSQSTAPSCPTQLGSLNVCAPFVVPGAPNPNPSPDCCTALQTVDHDCLCNTLRVSARLPALCNFPPLSCPAL